MQTAHSAPPLDESTPRRLTADERAQLSSATRQRVLEEAGLLGDPVAVRAESLDRICELVVRNVDAPGAHVSIVTPVDQRFAGAHNVDLAITSRPIELDRSWCQFVTVDRAPLVIEDTVHGPVATRREDLAEFGVRSYAGVPLITPDGTSIGALCAIDAQPRQWSEDELGMLRQLANFVILEVELRRQVQELERADRLKDDLVAMVTHELRNPLTTIAGSALLLDEAWDELDDRRRRQLVELMHRQGQRVGGLMEDLHALVRIDAGAVELRDEDVRIDVAIASAVSDAVAAPQIGAVIVPEDVVVRGDGDRIEQVLVNLLTNAQKYGAAPIDLDVSRNGHEVHVRVTDSGAGVPVEFEPRLFERFSRAPASARRQPGSGLGLAMVRGFAREMGGDVRYERRSDGRSGATFVLVLPAASTS